MTVGLTSFALLKKTFWELFFYSPSSTWTEPIIDVLGSGGNCGDTAGNKYCGQTLNVAKEQTASIPICDCSAPFFVGIVTDNVRDENSDKTANRGDTI